MRMLGEPPRSRRDEHVLTDPLTRVVNPRALEARMRKGRLRPGQLAQWAIAAIALMALLGWILDLPLLTSWAPGTATLKPMTALSFLALVLALWAAD